MRLETLLDFGPVKGFKMGYAPVGKPLMQVICYYLDNILIDSGAQNTRPSLLRLLDSRPINGLYLTHYHEDHAGNAAFLSQKYQIPVFAHPLTQQKLAQHVALRPYEKYMWGCLESVAVTPLTTTFNSDKYRFSCIHTPGHSSDHQVFLEEEQGWLFSGDMFLGTKIKYFRRDENILQTIDSLKLMVSLNFDKLFCGHNPQLAQPQKYLQKKIDYLENIYAEVKHLYSQGLPATAVINQLLKGKEQWPAKIITLGDASYKNILLSALACIDAQQVTSTQD